MSEPIIGRNLLIGGGAAACAACCAAPVLAVIGVTVAGTAATVAALVFAGFAFAIVIAALTAAGVVLRRPVKRDDGGREQPVLLLVDMTPQDVLQHPRGRKVTLDDAGEGGVDPAMLGTQPVDMSGELRIAAQLREQGPLLARGVRIQQDRQVTGGDAGTIAVAGAVMDRSLGPCHLAPI